MLQYQCSLRYWYLVVQRVALTYFAPLSRDFKYWDTLCFRGDTVCSNNGYIFCHPQNEQAKQSNLLCYGRQRDVIVRICARNQTLGPFISNQYLKCFHFVPVFFSGCATSMSMLAYISYVVPVVFGTIAWNFIVYSAYRIRCTIVHGMSVLKVCDYRECTYASL